MSLTLKDRLVVSALVFLSLFSICIRIPSLTLGLPPYIFVDEIFFFDDTYRSLNNKFFFPQAFISGSLNELPFWLLGKLFVLFGYEFSYSGFLVFGRAIGPVLLAGLTIFPLYQATRNFTGRRIFGISAGLIFASSEWIFSNSQIWYPDHYVYFFASVFLWQLSKFWMRIPHKNSAVKLGISLGLVISVKYTAILFVLLLIAALLKRPMLPRETKLATRKYFISSLSISVLTYIILNYSLFKYFHGFLAGMNSNRKNYRFLTDLPFENLLAYSQLFILHGIGWLGVASLIFSLNFWWRTKRNLFTIFSFTTFTYLVALSTSPIMLPRNINVLLPILIIVASPGLALFANSIKNIDFRVIVCGLFVVLALIGSAVHLGKSIEISSRIQSTELLENYLKSRSIGDQTIGINFGSNGPSPVETLGIPFINDPDMSENLDLYVFNSYWESPVRSYFYTRGYFSSFSSRDFHFNESSPKSAMVTLPRKEKIDSLLPNGYRVAKIIESVGPVYIVIERAR